MLRSELVVLRANPLPKESPESLQDKKTLTMALRRLSEELNLAEATILERNNELASARNAAARAKYASDNAYELSARIRGREEEGKQREFELERRVRAAEEEARMSDLVVKEYASLVRSLNHKNESRPVDTNTSLNNNAVTLTNSLSEGKIGLQKLLAEFNAETERLNAEVLRLQGELAELGAQLDAEKKGAHDGRLELSRVQLELQRLQRDDNAAAKMVSRYMKFSQHATDVLQTAMDSLKTRHAATVDTLSSQISALASEIEPLHSTIERLRQALDELTGNILRETYGRRREVALRIRLVGREERTRESLQRFIHRYHDAIRRDELPTPWTAISKSSRTLSKSYLL
ncbi:hypothetical protein BD779DRAFT_1675432 [Infundibulicybe gibba]|nr:hypothetical protein BD779DRAFT_1675432 [Infundibulicybe gibba]